MSNGILRNCASGACCPPPRQTKALAVTIKEIAEGEGSPMLIHKDRRVVAAEPTEFYLHIAAGLIEQDLIGVLPEEAERLRKEGSPTDEELDEMLKA